WNSRRLLRVQRFWRLPLGPGAKVLDTRGPGNAESRGSRADACGGSPQTLRGVSWPGSVVAHAAVRPCRRQQRQLSLRSTFTLQLGETLRRLPFFQDLNTLILPHRELRQSVAIY